jgi:hypothetical protein
MLFSKFKDALVELWDSGKELQITSIDQKMPEILYEDFPWYWN